MKKLYELDLETDPFYRTNGRILPYRSSQFRVNWRFLPYKNCTLRINGRFLPLLTIDLKSPHKSSLPKPSRRNTKPNQVSDNFSILKNQNNKQWHVLLVKIESMNNFAIHSKFHLNNGVFVFRSHWGFKPDPMTPHCSQHIPQ